jgi:hypothetical protein
MGGRESTHASQFIPVKYTTFLYPRCKPRWNYFGNRNSIIYDAKSLEFTCCLFNMIGSRSRSEYGSGMINPDLDLVPETTRSGFTSQLLLNPSSRKS